MDMTNHDRFNSLRKYAYILESKFKIPGTNFTFGFDPIINLIPGIGSYSGLILGLIFIILAHTKGVSGKVKILMFKNVLIDYLLGAIPIVGHFTDFFYKSNEKNLRLIEENLVNDKHAGSGIGLIILFVVITIAILILTILFIIWILAKFFSFII